MPADTSTAGQLLKEDFGPALRTQLSNETPLLDSFEKRDNVRWVGRERVEPIRVNRNRGVYFTAEGGRPPAAGNQQTENLRIPVRYTHGAIQLTAQLMKASKSDKGAFVSALKLETEGLLDDLRMQRLFAMWGDGRGIRALLNGDPVTGTTLTLDAPGGFAGPNHGNRFLNVGDYVVAVDPTTGAVRAGGTRRIDAIAAGGTTATINAACDTAWADNDFIIKAYGSDASITIGDTDWQHPMMGMMGMIDNGTYVNMYFNLSRTQYPVLQATRINNVGALSADVIQRGIDVAMQIGSAKITEHWVHPDTRRAYLTLMEQDRRYTAESLMNPNAGTKIASGQYSDTLSFGGVPIKTDPHAPYGTWFGCDTRSAVRYILEEGQWADETGEIFVQVANAVDTYSATYRIYDNCAWLRPNQSFRLDDIQTTFVMAHIV